MVCGPAIRYRLLTNIQTAREHAARCLADTNPQRRECELLRNQYEATYSKVHRAAQVAQKPAFNLEDIVTGMHGRACLGMGEARDDGFRPPPQGGRHADQSLDARMKEDLHNAAMAMEAFYEPNHNSYRGATVDELEKLGYRPSEGVTLTILDVTDQGYKLVATAPGGSARGFAFDSITGRIEPLLR